MFFVFFDTEVETSFPPSLDPSDVLITASFTTFVIFCSFDTGIETSFSSSLDPLDVLDTASFTAFMMFDSFDTGIETSFTNSLDCLPDFSECFSSGFNSDEEKEGDAHKMMELTLSCGEKIKVDEILLATGFGKKLPGGILIQRDLIEKAGLEVSDFCGFPIVNEHLQWHPRIYTAGALAELELGPSARNIAGARLAAERILQSIKQ